MQVDVQQKAEFCQSQNIGGESNQFNLKVFLREQKNVKNRRIMRLENIAKGTTDPRVEFISQDHSAQFTKLEHVTISKSRLSINFKISTKHQHLD